jgi:3'-5' exonuclease
VRREMRGLDIETTSLSPEDGELRLIQLTDGEKVRVRDTRNAAPSVFREMLKEASELVAHNALFERNWIREKYGVDLDLHDTMIMSQVLYTGTKASKNRKFSHALGAVVKRELRRELDKEQQTSDWSAPVLTREQLTYAAMDAAVLPPLAQTLLRKIDRAGLRDVYELERRVSHAVAAKSGAGDAGSAAKIRRHASPSVASSASDNLSTKALLTPARWVAWASRRRAKPSSVSTAYTTRGSSSGTSRATKPSRARCPTIRVTPLRLRSAKSASSDIRRRRPGAHTRTRRTP